MRVVICFTSNISVVLLFISYHYLSHRREINYWIWLCI